MALRSRFAEDRTGEAAVSRGVRQYVIAAAGLDTFPWRQPDWARDVRIYFADMPESLEWALERFGERGLARPANTSFVPIDLETRQLGGDLVATGFDPFEPVFCSALGIIQFLTPDAIQGLFQFVARAPKGSELVLSCHPPSEDLDGPAQSGLRRSIERGAELGEPWLSLVQPEDVVDRLRRAGFSDIDHLTTEMAQLRYFAGRTDGLKAARSLQLIAATV